MFFTWIIVYILYNTYYHSNHTHTNQSTGSVRRWLVIFLRGFLARSQCNTSKSFLCLMNLWMREDEMLSIIVANPRKIDRVSLSSFVESNMQISITLHVTLQDNFGNNDFLLLANGPRKLISGISLKNIFS